MCVWLVSLVIGFFEIVGTIAIAKARPHENRTIWNPTFKKSGFQMFPDSKWSDFRSHLWLVKYLANSLFRSFTFQLNYLMIELVILIIIDGGHVKATTEQT